MASEPADSATIVVATDGPMTLNDNQPSESPFSCNICKKSYTRIDHLARHHRSHSRERPFICTICNKSFARGDLLKRHTTTHGSADDPSPIDSPSSTAKRRRTGSDRHRPRAQRACKACADAKARCEGDQPCVRCRQKSISCDYPPSRIVTTTPLAQSVESSHQTRPLHHRSFSSAGASPPSHQSSHLSPHPHEASNTSVPSNMDHLQNMPFDSLAHHGEPTDYVNLQQTLDQGTVADFADIQSLDFLPLFASNDDTAFDDLLKDVDLFRDDLDFGIDFAFNSPLTVDSSLQPPRSESTTTMPRTAKTNTDIVTNKNDFVSSGLRSALNIAESAQAFQDSLWLWVPNQEDHGTTEHRNLSLPSDAIPGDRIRLPDYLPAHQRMNDTTRGTVLAMVLTTCEPAIYSQVVSNFPSADLLTQLLHNSINFQSRLEFPWIHAPTINVNRENPEFLGSLIAHGAALAPKPDIRKLGFALQEVIRRAHPMQSERDNRITRDLRFLQGFGLMLEVGLWSGNRRKMEIAESFAMPLITMVRRAGHFRASKAVELMPQEQDTGTPLNSKWQAWVQQESFKRLALFLFYRDTRSSMSLLSQPLISYVEPTVNAPCRKDLWEASTALQWKTMYLQQQQKSNESEDASHTGRRWMEDSGTIFQNPSSLDVDAALLIATASIWPQIWQYQEMMTAARLRGTRDDRHSTLLLSSKRQDLLHMLEHIQMNAKEWHVELKPTVWVLHEQCSMHLHVSLDDVQRLAGKEGEEEARRVFPIMSAWAKTSEARQALFHAGQILRAAKAHERFMLRDASAVAVYHASLIFWTYAITRGSSTTSDEASRIPPGGASAPMLIRLDDVEGPELRGFLVLGRGIPCVQSQMQTDHGLAQRHVPISEPVEIMKITTRILQSSYEGEERSNPPLVDNLSRLMHSLGRAYRAERPG